VELVSALQGVPLSIANHVEATDAAGARELGANVLVARRLW